jgi:N-acetylglucosamine kinase-like BadF-type ATPase
VTALYLGVDAGNSKTAALVCRPTGEVVGAGRAGCGDVYGAESAQAAVDAVFTAVDEALAGAGARPDDLKGAALRLAGVDWPEDRDLWSEALAKRWPAPPPTSILNDGYAAIRCGEPSGTGVAVIGGTSAAVAARGPDGRLWDLGMWSQHSMGAMGLVHEAVRAIVLADLGEAPPTRLTQDLPAAYGLGSVRDLVHWCTRRVGGPGMAEFSRSAPVVTAAAADGDPVAAELVREQGRRFARYAGVAARQVGLTETGGSVSVVLSGSVLQASDSPVTAALLDRLRAHVPHAVPHRAVLPPVAGAVLDALAEGGEPVDAGTGDRIAASAGAATGPQGH